MTLPQLKDLVFYQSGEGRRLYGARSEHAGFIFPWLKNMNRFGTVAQPVPKGFRKVKPPSRSWIREFMYNPRMHRVIRQPLKRRSGEDLFLTHDNGGRPFFCRVSPRRVQVFRIPHDAYTWDEDFDANDDTRNFELYTQLVLELVRPKRVWVGEDVGRDPHFHGNSMLILGTDGAYYFVGERIYSFVTQEPITDFYSRVGNSDVPYPVAASQSRVYFMLDQVSVPREDLRLHLYDVDMADAYDAFYAQKDELSPEPFVDCKLIQKRI